MVNWICRVCKRMLPPGYLKSRRWIGLCYRCDSYANEAVIEHLELTPVGKASKWFR